jgi:ABC-type branched-subunit amino acid transport system substrate-binding protein
MTARNLPTDNIRRRTLKALAAAGVSSLAGALPIPRLYAQDKAPIKIGVVLPLSGAYAANRPE